MYTLLSPRISRVACSCTYARTCTCIDSPTIVSEKSFHIYMVDYKYRACQVCDREKLEMCTCTCTRILRVDCVLALRLGFCASMLASGVEIVTSRAFFYIHITLYKGLIKKICTVETLNRWANESSHIHCLKTLLPGKQRTGSERVESETSLTSARLHPSVETYLSS